jgi:DNA-binding NarL/FixJ family response regulator
MEEECFMKILLVDDNPIFLEGLKNLLEAACAAEIDTAQSGREALEKAARFTPDIVLMDVEMKPFSGVETAQLLRKKDSRVKIVLMSEREVDTEQIKCCGAVGFLDKNMDAKALFELLGRMERDGP